MIDYLVIVLSLVIIIIVIFRFKKKKKHQKRYLSTLVKMKNNFIFICKKGLKIIFENFYIYLSL